MVKESKAIIESTAVMNDTETYRYSLKRTWDTIMPKITYVLLNPSKAEHLITDNTLAVCMNYAIKEGYGSLEIVNLFAYRDTNFNNLKKVQDPIGPDNDRFVLAAVENANTIVLGWGGENGRFRGRDRQVLDLLSKYRDKFMCFDDNRGHKRPQHPGRLKSGYRLIKFI